MRREDKEITDIKILDDIFTTNTICRVAFSVNDTPYIVSMNYGYFENGLYLHSSKEGKKMDMIKKNNKVCFEISDSIEIRPSDTVCDFGVKYRSIIGYGKIKILEEGEKKEALDVLIQQHNGHVKWNIGENRFKSIAVLKIEIESVTGKISGF